MWFSRFFPRTLALLHSPFNSDIAIIEKNARTSLVVNGVEQSGQYVDTLFGRAFKSLEDEQHKSVRRILVIGVGGGIALRRLRAIYPGARIVGVDIDPVIVDAAKKYFMLGNIGNCSFVISDARKYIGKRTANHTLFDLVVVDIFIGNDVPEFVAGKRFLEDVKKCMRPGGKFILNYFSFHRQPEKSEVLRQILSEIFPSVEVENILRNKIFHCS
jgi:spermidine synthase